MHKLDRKKNIIKIIENLKLLVISYYLHPNDCVNEEQHYNQKCDIW